MTRVLVRLLPFLLFGPLSAQLQWTQRALPVEPPRGTHLSMAHDPGRGRSVLLGAASLHSRAETWEWDGTAWLQRQPALSPPPGSRLAYDATRQRVLSVGGLDSQGGPLGETWDWDGTSWTRSSPASFPLGQFSLAHDAARGLTVAYGWSARVPRTLETWEWDGANWMQRSPASGPAPALGEGMSSWLAYDGARARTILLAILYSRGGQRMETWEWDGTDWSRRSPTRLPEPSDYALAYDTARSVIVAVALWSPVTVWEWDGTEWSRRPASAGPTARGGAAAAYDPARRRLVMHGGSGAIPLGDTWEWDGASWARVARELAPGPVEASRMVYDSARRRTVLVQGGFYPLVTWEREGDAWSLRSEANPPPPVNFSLAYDPIRGRTLLCGSGYMWAAQALWAWDGRMWRQLGWAPPQRWNSPIAFDTRRGRVVLFGGQQQYPFFALLGDTWEWDGTRWLQRLPPLSPLGRERHGLAYDQGRAVTVLYGGTAGGGSLTDTWEWDGTAWTALHPASSPGVQGTLVYDPVRRRVVLLGNDSSTWDWDGVDWILQPSTVILPPRRDPALYHDPERGRLVLFGGVLDAGPQAARALADLWELVAASSVIGPGHPGGGLSISCAPPPRTGAGFCVSFSHPRPVGAGVHYLLMAPGHGTRPPLPFGPPAFCAPALLHLLPQAVLAAYGDPARFCFSLLPGPELVGQVLAVQGASLETGACLRATDALLLAVEPGG